MADTTGALAVTLPQPSPALRAHMAADKLRRAAEAAAAEVATATYWGSGWARGVDNALGGPSGELAALLSPELALGLADLLNVEGQRAVHAAPGWRELPSHIEAIVNAVLGEAR